VCERIKYNADAKNKIILGISFKINGETAPRQHKIIYRDADNYRKVQITIYPRVTSPQFYR